MDADVNESYGRTRVRARTETARLAPTIPSLPLPTLKAGQRDRSSSVGATFVSTAVVPAPDSTEILSSLISSLTVLTDTARDEHQDSKFIEPVLEQPFEDLQNESFIVSDSEPEYSPPTQFLLDPSDDEVAEPPVVGYARGPVKPVKKSVRERWAAHRAGRNASMNSLNGTMAKQTLRAPGIKSGFGIPSIERPPSAAAIHLPVSASRPSLDQTIRAPLKMLFPVKTPDEYSCASSILTRDDDTKSTRTTRSKNSTRYQRDFGRRTKTPDVPSIPPLDNESELRKIISDTSTSKTHNPLHPRNREDLDEHVIPSRRSSARNSPTKSIQRPASVRTVSSNREVKPAIVEDDVEEEEETDPTLRRIRQLQRAREKRESERENESERVDRSRRRLSLSKFKPLVGETIVEMSPVLVQKDSPKPSEEIPSVSATIHGPELSMLPVFDGSKASPSLSPSTPNTPSHQFPRTLSIPNGRSHGAPPSPMKHKRGFSGSIRRSGSLRRGGPSETRSVNEEVELYLSNPRFSQKIRHPRTDRAITFSEVGDPAGFAVLVCVGMGVNRLVTVFYDELARTQKLRLITPDRPGTGESDSLPDTVNPPLAWADDVMVICQYLNINTFSLLAHSAGTMYALATALKMPNYVRGKIQLLAPWIPQSQLVSAGDAEKRNAKLPTSHKLLSMLPTGILKAANSRLLSAATIAGDSKPNRKKDKAFNEVLMMDVPRTFFKSPPTPDSTPGRMSAMSFRDNSSRSHIASPPISPSPTPGSVSRPSFSGIRNQMTSPGPGEQLSLQARQALYDKTLTDRIATLAAANVNRQNDLIVCFERRRTVGFLYSDVTRNITIHHGRLDERVPLLNVQYIDRVLPNCELRVLDDMGHNLLSNATVISNVLNEISREWEDLEILAREKERKRREREEEAQARFKEQRDRFIRTGKY